MLSPPISAHVKWRRKQINPVTHSEDAIFRSEVRSWLTAALEGPFRALRGLGGPGREDQSFQERLEWDRHLTSVGWTCIGWPIEYGGRGLPLSQQVIFHEEYARAGAPARVNHLGEELLGPTLIAFGTEEQKARFLPKIRAVEELWCQGYSEPNAGSDLAAVSTKAHLDGDTWVLNGQKVWTSLAQDAQWCFVLCRTEAGSSRHAGLSYLLVPMDQPGVEVRPIRQLTGGSEFNEVFFTDARTSADLVVGEVGQGWVVAMGTFAFERGVSTIGQQIGFARELQQVVDAARANGSINDPVIADRIVQAQVGLDVARAHALRTLSDAEQTTRRGVEASVQKLLWAPWHRALGELAMDVLGAPALTASGQEYDLDDLQMLFLFSRADTIYGGSDEVQRNIIAERYLGLPKG